MDTQDYLDLIEREYTPGDPMNEQKAEVAWVLNLEPGSDEWDELMGI